MKEPKPEKNESDYRSFQEFIERGEAQEAYALLKQNPHLCEFLRAYDVPEAYVQIAENVGANPGYDFLELYMRTQLGALENTKMAVLLRKARPRNEKDLEKALGLLSESTRRRLKEMGKNERKT